MDRPAVAARLRKFEGSIAHMYQCTGGEVTIGVGHAIPNPAAAAQLKWNLDGTAAQADFQKVASARKGMVASAYAPLTQCRMADAEIETLLQGDIALFEARVSAALPNWNTYPEPVQQALFDMAYNLGVGGLKKFVKMLAAVDAGDWNAAAAQCRRNGIGDARNNEIAALFRSAAG